MRVLDISIRPGLNDGAIEVGRADEPLLGQWKFEPLLLSHDEPISDIEPRWAGVEPSLVDSVLTHRYSMVARIFIGSIFNIMAQGAVALSACFDSWQFWSHEGWPVSRKAHDIELILGSYWAGIIAQGNLEMNCQLVFGWLMLTQGGELAQCGLWVRRWSRYWAAGSVLARKLGIGSIWALFWANLGGSGANMELCGFCTGVTILALFEAHVEPSDGSGWLWVAHIESTWL